MTFVVAFRYGRGVVLASDSRAVSGASAEEVRKLKPIYISDGEGEVDLAVVGGAGDGAVVKQSFRDVEAAFKEFYYAAGRHPRGGEMHKVAEDIQRRLLARYRELRSLGYEPEASLIVAAVDGDGNPYIFRYSGGILDDRTEDGYAMVGIGRDTGGVLLLSLLGYGPEATWDMGLLALLLIAAVNPYVSPLAAEADGLYIRWQDGKVVMGPLEPEAFQEYKQRAKKRIQLIRALWQLAETCGEEAVEKALEAFKSAVEEAKS